MGFRSQLEGGEGWLPPDARLVRGSGEALFIEPRRAKTRDEATAFAKGWFSGAFKQAAWAIKVGARDDLDPDTDADLLNELDKRPAGTWIAFGIAYRSSPDALLADEGTSEKMALAHEHRQQGGNAC